MKHTASFKAYGNWQFGVNLPGAKWSGMLAFLLFWPICLVMADDAGIAKLSEQLGHSDPNFVRMACEAIGKIATSDYRPTTREALEMKAYPVLVEQLRSTNRTIRNAAAFALGTIGPTSQNPLPALIQAWREDALVGRNVAGAMVRIGPAQDVMPLLAAALRCPQRRGTAALALRPYGPDLVAIHPQLHQALAECANAIDRNTIAGTIGLVGPPAAASVPLLRSMLPVDRRFDLGMGGCLQALGRIGPAAAEAAPDLAALMVFPGQSVIGELSWALREMGPGARHAAPILYRGLELEHVHKRGMVLQHTILVLKEWDAVTADMTPQLIFALRNRHEGARNAAADVLVDHALDDPRALAALIAAFSDERQRTLRAAYALARRGEDGLPTLAEALNNTNWDIQLVAADALAGMGLIALPLLEEHLQAANPMVRSAAAYSLGLMGEAEAIPILCQALQSDNRQLRATAARAVAAMGPRAKDAVPFLRHVIHGQVETGRGAPFPPRLPSIPFSYEDDIDAAVVALAMIAPEDPETFQLLHEMLSSKTRGFTITAVIEALGLLGVTAAPATEAICGHVSAVNSTQAETAILALGRIGPDTAELAMPALIHSEDRFRRFLAPIAQTLTIYGEKALPALPALVTHFDRNVSSSQPKDFETARILIGAMDAIGATRPDVTLPIHLRWLCVENLASQGNDAKIRLSAARAIGNLGSEAEYAIPFLRRAMETDSCQQVRSAAQEAIQRIREGQRTERPDDM